MSYNDSLLAKLVATNISNGLEELRVMRMTSDSSLADQSSTVSQLLRRLKTLNKKGENLERYIKEFEEMVGKAIETKNISVITFPRSRVAAVTAAGNSKKIMDELEKNLQLAKIAYEELRDARSIQAQAKALLGKKAPSIIKSTDETVERFTKKYNRVKSAIAKLSNNQKPAIFSTKKNELLGELMEYIQTAFDKVVDDNPELKKNKPSFNLKKSTFMMDIARSSKGAPVIKFARFIPMTNLPTRMGDSLDTYLVFLVNMFQPKERAGKISSKSFSPIELTVSDDIVKPLEITDAHVLSKPADIKAIMEWICAAKDLVVFGQGISGTPEKRRQKLRGLGVLKLLENDDIKVKFDGPLVICTLPKTVYRKLTPSGEIDNSTVMNLLLDIQRLAGFSKNDRYAGGAVKYVDTKQNKNGTVDAWFRINNSRKVDLIDPQKLTEDYINRLDQKRNEVKTDKHELSDAKFMEELKKQAEKRDALRMKKEREREDEEDRTTAKYKKRDALEREREAKEFADDGDDDD